MSDFDKLERVLKRRAVPDVPAQLAVRIAAAARQRKAVPLTWGTFLQDVFVLPHPQYVLAACLAAGLLIGFGISTEPQGLAFGDLYYGADMLSEEAWL